jgi:hypothetical protein
MDGFGATFRCRRLRLASRRLPTWTVVTVSKQNYLTGSGQCTWRKGKDQVDQILGQILQQAVWERLDLLDELAGNADAPSLASVARTELPRMTNGWRLLLRLHEPDHKGNCPTCSSRWRAHKAPCSVWHAVHQHLVASESMAQPLAHASHAYEVGTAMPRVRRAALR